MTLSKLLQRTPTDTFQAVIIIGGAGLAFSLLQVEPSTPFRCGKLTKIGPQVCSSDFTSGTGSTAAGSGQSWTPRLETSSKRIEGRAKMRFVI